MQVKRFVFHFPKLNLFEVVSASCLAEARQQLMEGRLAPFYNQAVLISND
jgi:hypothetical protein